MYTETHRGPKVCFVTDQYPPDEGTVARASHRLASNLHKDGYEVHVFVRILTPWPHMADDSESQPPYIRRVPSDLARLHAAVNFWHERIGFDLFHGFSIPAASACCPIAGRYKRPVIANISNPIQESYQDRQAYLALRHSSWIVATSAASLARAHKVIDIASRSSVIPIGLDDIAVIPWSIRSVQRGTIGILGMPSSESFFLTYAQLNEHIDCELIPLSCDLNDRNLGAKQVSKTHVSDFLRMHLVVVAADAGVPSELLEAVAVGVPIVANAVGWVKDIFTHGRDCLLVDPWDHRALAHAVETIMRDDLLAQRIGEGARKLAETMGVGAEQAEYRNIYARLLDREF